MGWLSEKEVRFGRAQVQSHHTLCSVCLYHVHGCESKEKYKKNISNFVGNYTSVKSKQEQKSFHYCVCFP